jgi:molecular chaperone GrpE (heat shock protein)
MFVVKGPAVSQPFFAFRVSAKQRLEVGSVPLEVKDDLVGAYIESGHLTEVDTKSAKQQIAEAKKAAKASDSVDVKELKQTIKELQAEAEAEKKRGDDLQAEVDLLKEAAQKASANEPS